MPNLDLPEITLDGTALLRAHWRQEGVTVLLEDIMEGDGQFLATTTISYLDQQVYFARLNLLAVAQRASMVRSLAQVPINHRERDERPPWNWEVLLNQLTFQAVMTWRRAGMTVDLDTVPLSAQPAWLLRPYLEYGGPTVLYAQGGSGKSTVPGAQSPNDDR